MRAHSLILALTVSTLACDSGNKAADTAPADVSARPDEAPPTTPEPEAPSGPSNEPTQTWTQAWATPTGQATGRVAAVSDGRVYVIAGPFMEHGTPASHVIALAADSGELLWDYADEEPLNLEDVSDKALDVSRGAGIVILDASTGKKTKPKKADSDATTPFEQQPAAAEGCAAKGETLDCGAWSVTEAGSVHALQGSGDRVCYAVAGAREVRCRAAATGDLAFVVAVPAVPDVKEPRAVNFSVHVIGDQLFVGNYDGTVLAYQPGS